MSISPQIPDSHALRTLSLGSKSLSFGVDALPPSGILGIAHDLTHPNPSLTSAQQNSTSWPTGTIAQPPGAKLILSAQGKHDKVLEECENDPAKAPGAFLKYTEARLKNIEAKISKGQERAPEITEHDQKELDYSKNLVKTAKKIILDIYQKSAEINDLNKKIDRLSTLGLENPGETDQLKKNISHLQNEVTQIYQEAFTKLDLSPAVPEAEPSAFEPGISSEAETSKINPLTQRLIEDGARGKLDNHQTGILRDMRSRIAPEDAPKALKQHVEIGLAKLVATGENVHQKTSLLLYREQSTAILKAIDAKSTALEDPTLTPKAKLSLEKDIKALQKKALAKLQGLDKPKLSTWGKIGSILSGALLGAGAVLLTVALVSNPVGWGILGALGAIFLISAFASSITLAKYTEKGTGKETAKWFAGGAALGALSAVGASAGLLAGGAIAATASAGAGKTAAVAGSVAAKTGSALQGISAGGWGILSASLTLTTLGGLKVRSAMQKYRWEG